MAGAYSAVADDALAVYWNPAGLARLDHQELVLTHADLFQTGIKDDYLTLAVPITLRHVLGFDWYHSGFDDGELGFRENRLDLSLGTKLWERVLVGGNLKYVTRQTDLDGSTLRSGGGLGLDLGLRGTLGSGLALALTATDLGHTRIQYDQGLGETGFAPGLRLGAAYTTPRFGTLAFDVDDRWHAGFELNALPYAALRAGIQRDRKGGDGPTYDYGVGFKAGLLRLDYAYEVHPVLEATHHFGLGLEFSFNAPQLRIEKVQTRDLFASMAHSYQSDSVVTVDVRNLKDQPVDVTVAVQIPGLLEGRRDLRIRPKSVSVVGLTANLSADSLERLADRTARVIVTATDRGQRVARTVRRAEKTEIYALGAINWSLGVGQAAAFVTPTDPVVDGVAREACRAASGLAPQFPSSNLLNAAAIFEALGVLGIIYVKDPNRPLEGFDTVRYPRETLTGRTGDCDDTTVLLAALLANVGIPSQFVDVPEHLFLLLDSGINERHALGLGVSEELLVIRDGEVWIPLETTAIGKPFTEAWQLAAEEYASWKTKGQLSVVDVSSAQEHFGSTAPRAGGMSAPALDTTRVRLAVSRDGNELGSWRQERLSTWLRDLPEDEDQGARAANELALVYYRAGGYAKARERLQPWLDRPTTRARVANNLGVLLLAEGDPRRAIGLFDQAAVADPADPGILLNRGVARCMVGDSARARPDLKEGIRRAGGSAGAVRILGLGSVVEAGDRTRESKDPVRELLAVIAAAQRERPARPGQGPPAAYWKR